jgi:hypothetical protein
MPQTAMHIKEYKNYTPGLLNKQITAERECNIES